MSPLWRRGLGDSGCHGDSRWDAVKETRNVTSPVLSSCLSVRSCIALQSCWEASSDSETRGHLNGVVVFRYHQYKFIVDSVWRHDEQAPSMPDPNGNVNNWVFVRNPEPAPVDFDPNFLLQHRNLFQRFQNQIAEQFYSPTTATEDVPMNHEIPHLLTERKEPVIADTIKNRAFDVPCVCLGVYVTSDTRFSAYTQGV